MKGIDVSMPRIEKELMTGWKFSLGEQLPAKEMAFSEVNLPHGYCIGSMIWTGIDYLGESARYPFKGRCNVMLRTNGDRRPMYYILQSYWTDKPMVHFSVMDYSLPDEGSKRHWSIPPYVDHWHFPQFHKAMIPYMIASNCEEVKLYLNGNEYLVQKPIQSNNRMITGYLPYQPGAVKVAGYKDGREVCCHEVVTPGSAVRLEFKEALLELPAKEGYEILLTVRALDIEKNQFSGRVA